MPRKAKAKPVVYQCAANPCSSCPYRKDTPPGVWAAEEYVKLPAYDDPFKYPGTFLCHHSATKGADSVCRGWLEVHSGNYGVRIRLMTGRIVLKHPEPTKVPLYKSGEAACRAGLRGIQRPSKLAKIVIDKLTTARQIARRKGTLRDDIIPQRPSPQDSPAHPTKNERLARPAQ